MSCCRLRCSQRVCFASVFGSLAMLLLAVILPLHIDRVPTTHEIYLDSIGIGALIWGVLFAFLFLVCLKASLFATLDLTLFLCKPLATSAPDLPEEVVRASFGNYDHALSYCRKWREFKWRILSFVLLLLRFVLNATSAAVTFWSLRELDPSKQVNIAKHCAAWLEFPCIVLGVVSMTLCFITAVCYQCLDSASSAFACVVLATYLPWFSSFSVLTALPKANVIAALETITEAKTVEGAAMATVKYCIMAPLALMALYLKLFQLDFVVTSHGWDWNPKQILTLVAFLNNMYGLERGFEGDMSLCQKRAVFRLHGLEVSDAFMAAYDTRLAETLGRVYTVPLGLLILGTISTDDLQALLYHGERSSSAGLLVSDVSLQEVPRGSNIGGAQSSDARGSEQGNSGEPGDSAEGGLPDLPIDIFPPLQHEVGISKYFGSLSYYDGELLQDWRYNYDRDMETLSVELPNRDTIRMWAFAIDVRPCEDPLEELPKRGFNEGTDYILFHYTHEQAFAMITSSDKIWSSQKDTNFGPGVYATQKAPHQWRSKAEILLNNYFPSKKDWEERKHLDFEEWPSSEALYFDKKELDDHEAKALLGTPFGRALLKKWQKSRTCDFCIPIVCDYHCAKDIMAQDTPGSEMFSGRTRHAGYNKFAEEQPKWRNVWTVVKVKKTQLQSGEWQMKLHSASQPAELIIQVLSQRYAKNPENEELRKQLAKAEAARKPQVEVVLLSGRRCHCDASQERTVLELKQEAEEEFGIEIQNLILAGKKLDEAKTLAAAEVLPGCTLTAFVGGWFHSMLEGPLLTGLAGACQVFSSVEKLKTLHLEEFDVPCFIVAGKTSAGKSTLLQRLTRMPFFPVDKQMCTRIPVFVEMRNGSGESNATVTVCTLKKDSLVAEQSKSEPIPIGATGREVQEKIQSLLRSLLEEAGLSKTSKKVIVDKEVRIRLSSPSSPMLNLVDLPGVVNGRSLVATDTQKLFKRYALKSSNQSVFLCAVEASSPAVEWNTDDVLGQGDTELESLELHQRCLGVITKADSDEVDVESLCNYLRGDLADDFKPRHGYFAVGARDEGRAQEEQVLFERLLAAAADRDKLQSRTSITALQKKVQDLYMDQVHKGWIPKTVEKVIKKWAQSCIAPTQSETMGALCDEVVEDLLEKYRSFCGSELLLKDMALGSFAAEDLHNLRNAPEGLCKTLSKEWLEDQAFFTVQTHYTLLLDKSASMSHPAVNSPFSQLTRAYNRFKEDLSNSNANLSTKVSVVFFNSGAEVMKPTHVPVQEMQDIGWQKPWNGTNFHAAFEAWHGLLDASEPSCKEAALFLTDGQADVPKATIQALLDQHGHRISSITCVAFGADADTPILMEIAQLFGQRGVDQQVLSAQSEDSLVKIFADAAASCMVHHGRAGRP